MSSRLRIGSTPHRRGPGLVTAKTNTRGISSLGSGSSKNHRIVRSPRGRVCAEVDCSTVLSAYNSAVLCWVHEVPRKSRPKPGAR